jgi:S-adenosylmethionine:tRNA ribosyltransferase-isomerase
VRLLHIDPAHAAFADHELPALPSLLRGGDLVVVNDAATLPASLRGRTRLGAVEVRLAGEQTPSGAWTAVLYGEGTWRQRTEDRGTPPALAAGDAIELEGGLRACVEKVSPASGRLVTLRFDREGAAFWKALYRAGRPVQYSYLCGPLALWHVQTFYGARPWAMEMPSAGWALSGSLVHELERRGIGVASLTHAAGLSSTGDPDLDALLPLPERFDIPEATVRRIGAARASGGRIVAVGTTVVRALEGCSAAAGGRLRAGPGRTDLRIGPGFVPRIVDGLLTGMHEPGTSHHDLMGAFAQPPVLEAAHWHAEAAGYVSHEFGDTTLVLAA